MDPVLVLRPFARLLNCGAASGRGAANWGGTHSPSLYPSRSKVFPDPLLADAKVLRRGLNRLLFAVASQDQL